MTQAASGRTVCARCQQPASTNKVFHSAQICDEGIALDDPAAATAAAAPTSQGEDWASRQRLRNLGRELRRPAAATAVKSNASLGARHRFEPPQNLFDQMAQITAPSGAPLSPTPPATALLRSRRTESSQIIAWLVVVAGGMGLIAGVSLIAWSLATKHLLHWNLALGLTLGGQGTLILGLVLVVSRLWRSSRQAAHKLLDVHTRLGQLQHTADALTAARGGGAPAFYADLVRGASPQVLLANLKGQVDQLATRLGSSW